MRNTMKFLAFAALIALLSAMAAGCTEQEANGSPASAPPPPPVKAMTIEARDIPLTYEYPAQVEGSREVDVRAQVGGILKERTYVEGSYVNAGDVLFRIAPDSYDASLEQAEGELERLKATMELTRLERDRTVSLYSQDAVSTQERDDAVSQYEAARAAVRTAEGALRTARINKGYTEVTAPISGITSKETVSEGSLVTTSSTGSLLTTITRMDPVYVNFSVPGTELLKLRRRMAKGDIVMAESGPTVRLRLSDGSIYEHAGRVTFTDKQEDPRTGTVRARAEVPNPDALVLPGGFVRVLVDGSVLKNAVVVPQRAVMFTQQAPLVFVLGDDNVPQARPVRLGDTVDNGFQILGGVKPGERIVAEGLMQIHPGSPVTVLPSAPQGAVEGTKTAQAPGGDA